MSEEILQQFIDAMHDAGCGPASAADIKADDKWHDIQIEGDAKAEKKGYYRLKISDGFGVGNFGNRRIGETKDWNSKASRKFTAEEKAAWKKKIDEERADREAAEKAEWDAAAKTALKLWDSSTQAVIHPYLIKKGIKPHNARISGENLLLPMYADSRLFSVQVITPEGEKLYSWQLEDGSWVKGARKRGCFCPLADHSDDKSILIICEGFATGASIREATGYPVIVAFDSGNLSPVAATFRLKYPDAMIIIASDNDQWTVVKDKPHNTGQIKGLQAAAEVKGFNIYPEFPEDDPAKRTDFNDLAQSESLGAVKDRIQQVIVKDGATAVLAPPVEQAPSSVEDHPPGPDSQAGGGDFYPDDYGDYTPSAEEYELMTGDFGLPFKVLGYDHGTFYYFPFKQRQIIALTAAGHTMNNLLQLASLSQWQNYFSAGRETQVAIGQIATLATNALIRLASDRGVFIEADRVRGCGAWSDAGRSMLHCGDVIYVDGVPMDPKNVTSRYVYIAAPKLFTPGDRALNNAEAIKLRQICEMPTWENKLSGSLLAGWLVIAPICTMLDWRPHLWLTGEAEAGKSTILSKIIKPTLGPVALNVDGGTTEPAIRMLLGYNGRPLIYDEAEAETNSQKNAMEAILGLTRKASSGSVVVKYGQKAFKAQFCACFSAINPPVKDFADETRIVMLNLNKNRGPNAAAEYKHMVAFVEETLTPEYQEALLTRIINNMPALLANIKTFNAAGRAVLQAARVSDQIAPLLSGLYLLHNTGVITQEKAEAWIKEQDWTFHTTINAETDPQRLVHRLATTIIRIQSSTGPKDITVGELILIAANINEHAGITATLANEILRQHSIVSKREGVTFGNRNQNLGKLLRDTAWWNGWNNQLIKVAGAKRREPMYFGAGDKQRGVMIPMDLFWDRQEQQVEMPLKTYRVEPDEHEEEVRF